MKKKENPKMKWILGIFGLFFVFSHNLSAHGEPHAKETITMAMMPFIKGKKPENVENIMTCGVNTLCVDQEDFIEGSEDSVAHIVHQILADKLGSQLLSPDKVKTHFDKNKKNDSLMTPIAMALELGNSLGVDYIIVGNVWRFRQRIGNAVAVEQPASVGFKLHLVDVRSGQRIWQATFQETQQSLSDDLFKATEFFKRGARWLTAEELAKYGAKRILKSFPINEK